MPEPVQTREELLREAYAAAIAAGYEDHLFGTAVILAETIVRLSERLQEFRRTTSGSDD